MILGKNSTNNKIFGSNLDSGTFGHDSYWKIIKKPNLNKWFFWFCKKLFLMKILLANKYYYPWGGDCIYTIELENFLKSKGHEVAIVYMDIESRGILDQ